MKIKEIGTLDLTKAKLKLSDNSITARQNNKTIAVINNVQKVQSLPFSRKAELNIKFQGKLNSFFDSLYISNDSSLYYFIDRNYYDLANKLSENGMTSELEKLNEKINTLTANGVNVIFAYTN